MRLSDFHYELPPELIAQRPPARREDSRLMVVRRAEGRIEHRAFRELRSLLPASDLLVLNDTRVIPARLLGSKDTGAQVEVFLIRERESQVWECLVRPGRRCPPGTRIRFGDGSFEARLEAADQPQKRLAYFTGEADFWDLLDRWGQVPLPPYIRRPEQGTDAQDRERYQTVFAHARGSVAAPTAGLHFTHDLLDRFEHCKVTLHVGYGTFQPVQGEIEKHQMEEEHFRISAEAAAVIQRARIRGGRVVAVGTTTTRTLESAARKYGEIRPCEGWTDLFIHPGHKFRAVDALITNFHLPESTLLMLVSALAGRELVLEAYREAVREKYRFFSYGDAMLVL